MKFTPKSDEQLFQLLPEGEYDFFVKQAEDTKSKSGNDMIRLQLGILDNENKEHVIFDYLLEAMGHKLKHFPQAVGMEDKYDAGGYEAADCVNKSGRCIVTKQEAQGSFGPKNSIKDYIKSDGNPAEKKSEFIEDELPF